LSEEERTVHDDSESDDEDMFMGPPPALDDDDDEDDFDDERPINAFTEDSGNNYSPYIQSPSMKHELNGLLFNVQLFRKYYLAVFLKFNSIFGASIALHFMLFSV
jgi:hypothetical protein